MEWQYIIPIIVILLALAVIIILYKNRKPMEDLSDHFTYQEFIDSQIADQLDIDNTPTIEHIEAGKLVCQYILEPVRAYTGKGFSPNSFYRCMKLNGVVGGSNNSQHQYGQAVDFKVIGFDLYDLACWIRDNLKFDQLILEYYNDPTGWLHCSFVKETDEPDSPKNRQQVLTKQRGKPYQSGLIK